MASSFPARMITFLCAPDVASSFPARSRYAFSFPGVPSMKLLVPDTFPAALLCSRATYIAGRPGLIRSSRPSLLPGLPPVPLSLSACRGSPSLPLPCRSAGPRRSGPWRSDPLALCSCFALWSLVATHFIPPSGKKHVPMLPIFRGDWDLGDLVAQFEVLCRG